MDDVLQVHNYINGVFQPIEKYLDSINPATGEVVARIPNSTTREVHLAVVAASNAFNDWSRRSVKERTDLLMKVADVLESRIEDFAWHESREQGKPLWLAKQMDIPRAVYNFRHFATTALSDLETSCSTPENGLLNYTIHEAVGVAAVVTPWNLPLYLLTFKLAPALVYGNTVVAKPSEFTSTTAFKLCQIFEEVGFPPGVVNIVFGTGPEAGKALVSHSNVSLVSFTGGTETGMKISQLAYGKKLSLEMGGKNAALVFKDFDFNLMKEVARSCFLNQGEICLCSSRIYVERSIMDQFVSSFATEMNALKVGDPMNPDSFMGPLISGQHLEKVTKYLEIAKEEGATIFQVPLNEELNSKGFFFPLTMVTGLKQESKCMREEIFGPFVCIVPFDDEKSAVEMANDTIYGLCATIWTSNVNIAHRVARELKVGTVWINCWLQRNLHMPFGGSKKSGLGREGTLDSREFFTSKKTVCLKIH